MKRYVTVILIILFSFAMAIAYGQTSTMNNAQKLSIVVALRSMEDSLGMKIFSLAQQTRRYRIKETKEFVTLRAHLLACRYFRSRFDDQLQ